MPQPNLADSFHGPARYNTVPGFAKNSIVPGFAKNNIVLGSSTTGLTPRLNLVPQAPAGRGGLNNSNLSNISSGPKPSPSAPTTGYQDSALDPASTTTLAPDSLFNPTSTNSNPATTPTPPVTPLHSNPSTGTDSPPTRSTTPTNDDESPAHRWLPALLILLLLLGIGWFFKTRIDTRLARQAAEQAALSDRLNSLNDDASLNNLNVANLTSKLATIENLNVTDTATINHLRVTGDSNLSGGVNITGPLTLNGDLVSGNITSTTSTTGSSTTTGQGTFGSLLVQGDATVQGNTSLNSLSAGATTLNSLIVSGNTQLTSLSLSQNLSVAGLTTLQQLIAGNTTLNSLTAGNTTLQTLNVNGATTLSTLTVTGASLLQGPVTTGDNLTIGGDLVLNGGNFTTPGPLALSTGGAFTLTPGGPITIGSLTEPLTLQGSNTILSETNAGFTTTFGFTTPTANTTINLPALPAGNYDVCTNSGNCVGGGGSAPAGADYLTLSLNPSLTNERVLTAGSNLTLTDGGANGPLTIAVVASPTFTNGTFSGNVAVGTLNGLSIGNTAGSIPISNGTLNTNLNADLLDGLNSTAFTSSTLGFIQGGNSFGSTAILGTNDAFDLQLETGGTTKLTIQNSTGNVGIGTTSPLFRLEVVDGGGVSIKSTNTVGQPQFWRSQTSASDTLALFYTEVANGSIPVDIWQLRSGGTVARNLVFSNYDSAPLLFLGLSSATGNVGIGTTAPAYKLDVVGDINSSTQLRVGGNVVCTSTGCTGAGGAASFVQGGNSFGSTATLGTNDAFDLALETGGTTKLTVQNSTGNVGIGTTSPSALLSVGSSSQFRVNGSGDVTARGFILSGNGGASSLPAFQGGSGQLIFSTASGGWGFGNTIGATDISTSNGVCQVSLGTSGMACINRSNVTLFLSPTATPSRYIRYDNGLNTELGYVDTNLGQSYSLQNAATIGLQLKGAASQTADLTQWQNSAGTVLARVDANGNGFFANGSGGTGAGFVQGGNSFGSTAILGTNDAFDLQLETGGTTKLTVQNSTGRVGIGTAAPLSLLHLYASGATTTVVQNFQNDTRRWSMGINGTQDTFRITDNTAGADRMTISNTGLVGFGTSTPSAKIHATTTSNFATFLDLGSATTTIGSGIFHSSITDAQLTTNAFKGVQIQSEANFSNDVTKTINGLSVLATTPNGSGVAATNLTLRGTIGTAAHRGTNTLGNAYGVHGAVSNSGTGTITTGIGLQGLISNSSTGTISDAYGLQIANIVNTGTLTNTYGVYVGDITTGTQTNTPYSFYASDANAYNYFAGNVGIGTTTPAYKLDVVGDINSSTQLRVGGNIVCTSTGCTGSGGAASFVQGGNSFGSTATLGTNDAFDLALETGGTTKLTVQNSTGNVGIGTTSPGVKLDVQGTIRATVSGVGAYLMPTGGAGNDFRFGLGNNLYFDGTNWVTGTDGGNSGGGAILTDNATGSLNFFTVASTGSAAQTITNASLASRQRMTISATGNVGIGTTTPGSKLDVYNNTATSNVDLFQLRSDVGSANNIKFRVDSDGDIFTDGSVVINNPADVAENYQNNDGATPGDVVVFTNTTSVSKSSTPNQKALAGVVSTNPGLTLSGDTQGVPVALSGRVPVKVSVANGPIEIGDYLTSGPNGTALKATQAGPTIGTALTATSTNATIEVFVHLGHYTPTQTQTLQAGTGSALTQTQGSAGAFTALNVSGATTLTSLTVTGAATFQSNLTVAGTLTTQDIVVRGHIVGNEDTRGTITIPAGATQGTYTFTSAYPAAPNVVVTPTGNPGGSFWVSNITGTQFTINLTNPLSANIIFNFQIQQ